jgi:hypothetical protein|tara:strand:+ start:285 stop:686 length:402 start_codon:yes stop_codon:yes gene_type:complete
MAVSKVSRYFKDISLSFDPHPVTKDLPILKNERAIVRSVRNIVSTVPTEKFFNPTFGSGITGFLFENFDYATIAVLQDEIRNTILNNEPRVNNVRVDVDPYYDNNGIQVDVIFDIIGQDFPTQEFTFILEATR